MKQFERQFLCSPAPENKLHEIYKLSGKNPIVHNCLEIKRVNPEYKTIDALIDMVLYLAKENDRLKQDCLKLMQTRPISDKIIKLENDL